MPDFITTIMSRINSCETLLSLLSIPTKTDNNAPLVGVGVGVVHQRGGEVHRKGLRPRPPRGHPPPPPPGPGPARRPPKGPRGSRGRPPPPPHARCRGRNAPGGLARSGFQTRESPKTKVGRCENVV
eukprot:1180397-Prorocentrum_minimum.AAC.4